MNGRGTPINVGDGSLWISAPGIDDVSVWERSERYLRSPNAEGYLDSAELLVNGQSIDLRRELSDESVITVVYNGAATLTIATPESDDGHVHIIWNEPYGSGFVSGGRWHAGEGRWTYGSHDEGERITRILIDGACWYRARRYDTPDKRATSVLSLNYHFGAALSKASAE